jgi:hypothetical protein
MTGKLHHYVTVESSGQGFLTVLGGLVSLSMACLATLTLISSTPRSGLVIIGESESRAPRRDMSGGLVCRKGKAS